MGPIRYTGRGITRTGWRRVFEGLGFGGMSKGLPLATSAASQARLLVRGQIFQAFSNWLGTEMSLDIIFMPTTGTSDQPMNYVLNWTAGTTLASALANTFSTTFPKASIEIQLSPRLVQNHDEPGIYGSLTQLASLLNPLSKRIVTDPDYPGVQITYDGATLRAFDLTAQPGAQQPPKQIAFQDILGQPCWISPQQIQVKLVLRGDLNIGATIILPPNLATITAAALSSLSGNPAYVGIFGKISDHGPSPLRR
jgi:hypothetical protein